MSRNTQIITTVAAVRTADNGQRTTDSGQRTEKRTDTHSGKPMNRENVIIPGRGLVPGLYAYNIPQLCGR